MTEEQQASLQSALEKLRSLKTDFENAAAARERDKSLWPRRLPKSTEAYYFRQDFVRPAQEAIRKFESSDPVKGLAPLRDIFTVAGSAVDIYSELAQEFSRYRHRDKNYTKQAKNFDQKAKEIWELATKAFPGWPRCAL